MKLSYVPNDIIYAIAKIRKYGTDKYHDPDNWKGVSPDRYWESVLRHIAASWNDHGALDEESGLPHIWHAACDLAFIIALENKNKNLIFDEDYNIHVKIKPIKITNNGVNDEIDNYIIKYQYSGMDKIIFGGISNNNSTNTKIKSVSNDVRSMIHERTDIPLKNIIIDDWNWTVEKD